MRWPQFACAVLIALALAACGREGQQVTTQDGTPLAGAAATRSSDSQRLDAFDPCAGGGAPEAACADAKTRALAAKVAEAYRTATAPLSPEGRRIAAEGARAWAEAQGAVCAAAVDPGPTACFAAALAERLQEAAGLVRREGGYLFQRVETADWVAVTPEALARIGFGFGEDAPRALLRTVQHPRIDAPEREPGLERFNAMAAPQRIAGPQDLTEETVRYAIGYAGPRLISVRFTAYEQTLGAAHGNAFESAVTVLVPQGVLLRPDVVFQPGSRWEERVTELSRAELDAVFADLGAGPPDPADVRDTATKAHNWVITRDALVVLFPPYSIGPYALGGHEVAIPWDVLRPYLKADAPAPIGQGQG